MTSKAPAAILGLSIVIAAAIYTVPPLVNDLRNQNLVSTTVGGVRLGKIYNESLKAKVVVRNTETGDVFIEVEENADNVYKAARKKLDELVEYSNTKATSKEEKVTADGATLKVHMTVTINTHVSYRSEYQPTYTLTLEDHETTAAIGANVNRVLQQAQEYCDERVKDFQSKHQLLKI